MAIHILRDYLTQTPSLGLNPARFPMAQMYYSSIFMFHVLKFTQVGHTNFNLSGSLMLASGLGASINFGVTGSYSQVSLPSFYSVSNSDIGRILALRSTLFPTYNSGIYKITSASVSNNRVLVEYRAAEDPPVETNTLEWAIFGSEATIPISTGTPTVATGYKSRDTYAGCRIMLQTPHTSSWQIRFCYESSTDKTNHGSSVSHAIGFGGNSSADFPSQSLDNISNVVEHTHGPMFFDVSNARYQGSVVGVDQTGNTFSDITNVVIRLYGFGDDVSGSCAFVTRNSSSYADGWFSFGMVEDDERPAPPRISQRLFTMGRANGNTQDVRWNNGPASYAGFTGTAFGLCLQPVSCVWALYDYISQCNSSTNNIRSEPTAQDNTILGATELQRVDMWAGTSDIGTFYDSNWPLGSVLQFDPRRMGSMPMARVGRANFGNWTLTTDANKSWFHAKGGVFLPWNGPSTYA